MTKSIIALVLGSFMLMTAQAQTNFQGTINMGITVTGENADQMAGFMPESYEYQFCGNDTKFKMIGGMTAVMIGEFLSKGDEGKTYMIKHDEEIAYRMDEDTEDNSSQPTLTKLNETATILGYKCTKYKSVTPGQEGTDETVQYMWITPDIKIKPSKVKLGDVHSGMEGFPLKIEMETMGMTVTILAKEVKSTKLNPDDFKIPANYKIEKFNPARFYGLDNND